MGLEQIKKKSGFEKNRSIQIANDENRREDWPKVGEAFWIIVGVGILNNRLIVAH